MISRPNYDKPWRCPIWSGPGLLNAAHPRKCDGGSTASQWDKPLASWRFHRCPKCGCIILPYVIRHVDPQWWLYGAEKAIADLAEWLHGLMDGLK